MKKSFLRMFKVLPSLFIWFILFQDGDWFRAEERSGAYRQKWFHKDFVMKYKFQFIFPEDQLLGDR